MCFFVKQTLQHESSSKNASISLECYVSCYNCAPYPLGPSWDPTLLGPYPIGHYWAVLLPTTAPGPSWGPYGHSWDPPGRSWHPVGVSMAILGPSWAILGPSWAILGPPWTLWALCSGRRREAKPLYVQRARLSIQRCVVNEQAHGHDQIWLATLDHVVVENCRREGRVPPCGERAALHRAQTSKRQLRRMER